MILYLIEFTLSLILFYVIYIIILSKDTFFQARRFYLIGSLLFSCLLPQIIEHQIFNISGITYFIDLPMIEINAMEDSYVFGLIKPNYWSNLGRIVWILYFVGIGLFFVKLAFGIVKLISTINRGHHAYNEKYVLVNSKGLETPFSFFRYIVLDTEQYNEFELERILLHEEEHVLRWHSIDMMVLEMLSIMFWFHPMVYLFKKQIKINHEYQADQKVIARYSRKQYGHILLRQSKSGKEIVFANYFFHSFIKKRIMMMYNKRSNKNNKFKYLLVFPLVLGLLFSMSNCTNNDVDNISPMVYKDTPTSGDQPPSPPPPPPPPFDKEEEVFKVVDKRPRFPGCEDVSNMEERTNCAQKKMLNFIYKNIKYPVIAKANGVEGTVVLEFVVRKNGLISDIRIVRDIGDGCGEMAKSVIDKMRIDSMLWIPGENAGKAVSVKYTLPIKFKLQG